MSFFLPGLLITGVLLGSFFPALSSVVTASKAEEAITIEHYIEPFYNRYSRYFDAYGPRLQVPGYGKAVFTPPKNAREIMSIAVYFKYRALQGERRASEQIQSAIRKASQEIQTRPGFTQSFEDAIAQFLIVRMLQTLPDILPAEEKVRILQGIASRLDSGIRAEDSSNRAALAAAYWQYLVNFFAAQYQISSEEQVRLNQLLKVKITSVSEQDMTPDGWYEEGDPMRFNPHYHAVTAFSFLAYGELARNAVLTAQAKGMTENLRSVSFRNAMVEAAIGERPVGLGAQFYLAAGLLNARFGYRDFTAYLDYAQGDRFFSDRKHPNRLEYHATIEGKKPQYHDDFAFSNLSELALALSLKETIQWTQYEKLLSPYPVYSKSERYTVINYGDVLWLNDYKYVLRDGGNVYRRKLKLPSHETIFDNAITKPMVFRSMQDTDRDGLDDHEELIRGLPPRSTDSTQGLLFQPAGPVHRYGKERLLDLKQEQHQAFVLRYQMNPLLKAKHLSLSPKQWYDMIDAYIYGRYTIDEMLQTLAAGQPIISPDIPASVWRTTPEYRRFYLEQK